MKANLVFQVVLVALTLLSSNKALAYSGTLESWIQTQLKVSEEKIFSNIGPNDGHKGAVLASPSKNDPDYYYAWVRDAALVMTALYENKVGGAVKIERSMRQFMDFTRINQMSSGDANLGEPKYYVNGQPFTGPWGRPQNDGPALRAIVLAQYANDLIAQGKEDFVKVELYDGELPTVSLLKRDLEYVAHNWMKSSFDLWEEVSGDHFYTLVVSRKALILGAEIASRLNDNGAAQYYREQARLIKKRLLDFVNSKKANILPTLRYTAGHIKTSDLDIAVILGVLHGDAGDGFMSSTTPEVMNTLNDLIKSFSQIYHVNSNGLKGKALGRYPEDVYYGGNPWFLTTLAQAELLYKISAQLSRSSVHSTSPAMKSLLKTLGHLPKNLINKTSLKNLKLNQMLAEAFYSAAEDVLERVKFHAPADFRLSEQFNRDNGFCMAAPDLTWSYASFITAIAARESARANLH